MFSCVAKVSTPTRKSEFIKTRTNANCVDKSRYVVASEMTSIIGVADAVFSSSLVRVSIENENSFPTENARRVVSFSRHSTTCMIYYCSS